MEMSNQVVKVKREAIVACMTCPLCSKLLRNATTISECLHTFCRRCIHKKFSDEELECCPICNIDLGCVPQEKMRPDHNLEDVRSKIFPCKKRKPKAPEVMPSLTLPVRRKERSLSSLVVSTPRVLTQSTTTGRRTKSVSRKAPVLRGSTFVIKKDEDSVDVHPNSSSSPDPLNKFNQSLRQLQNYSTAEPSSHLTPSGETETGSDPWETKADLWKPLNCLVEVANRTKSFKCNSQGSIKSERLGAPDGQQLASNTMEKNDKHITEIQGDKNLHDPISIELAKPKKLRRVRRKLSSANGRIGISPQAVLDAAERRVGPIWFSLIASEDQEGDAPLPQISANYLRIKDGSLPVSFIQKYLVSKLELANETEVEIKCMGQPVVPDLQMHNLIDLWLQTTSKPQRLPASIGSSAKDFVLVLGYARKLPPPNS